MCSIMAIAKAPCWHDSLRRKTKSPATLAAVPGLCWIQLQFLEKCVLTIRNRVITALLVVAGSILLAGCPPGVSIAKLNRDPGRYAGKAISIAGRVTDSF